MITVYLETSVVSYLTARPSSDPTTGTWQRVTREWWAQARQKYRLCTSELTVIEAAVGDPQASRKRLEVLAPVERLVVDPEVESLAALLTQHHGIPRAAKADALHVALTAVHGIDILLTWNFRHIDNPLRKPLIRRICFEAGYNCPEICTPMELQDEIV
jgi:predicted nucleic acid-binding protein